MKPAGLRYRGVLLLSAVAVGITVGCGSHETRSDSRPPAAAPEYTAETATSRLVPGSKSLPPSLVGTEWTRLPTTKKVVALTFDCGSNAEGVDSILATLRAKGARATFFMCGRWAETYPARARRIAARFPVGNHTYSHPHLTVLSDVAVRRQVRRGEAAILRITGRDPRPLFRFPFGDRDQRRIRIVNDLGYGAIGWTIDTLGWKGRAGGQSSSTVVARVLAGLRPGAIVLMHVGAAPDGTTLDAAALPRLIDRIRARGYRLVTVAAYV
jgi:peptidoglycan/xylan/chitin deacetylase (PgdA/CDA1 family)